FYALVDEAAEVSVEGWDFSWLDGRATEERPSWGYQRLLSQKLATATAALDIQTGGGEVLAGAGAENFPPTLVATEGWPPNVAKATALLHPLGAVVVADLEEPPLPFADDAFDLVTSRHPATVYWSEIARVLRPAARTSRSTSVAGPTSRSANTSSDPSNPASGDITRSRPIRPAQLAWRSFSAATSAFASSSSTWERWCSSFAR